MYLWWCRKQQCVLRKSVCEFGWLHLRRIWSDQLEWLIQMQLLSTGLGLLKSWGNLVQISFMSLAKNAMRRLSVLKTYVHEDSAERGLHMPAHIHTHPHTHTFRAWAWLPHRPKTCSQDTPRPLQDCPRLVLGASFISDTISYILLHRHVSHGCDHALMEICLEMYLLGLPFLPRH